MLYQLMLLAEPGPPRADVLRLLKEATDIRPDAELDNRFWLSAGGGAVQIDIGTKDPVESVNVEFKQGATPFMAAAAERALEIARDLEMRVEDCQWGDEVTFESLPQLKEYWTSRAARGPETAATPAARPWWRIW